MEFFSAKKIRIQLAKAAGSSHKSNKIIVKASFKHKTSIRKTPNVFNDGWTYTISIK